MIGCLCIHGFTGAPSEVEPLVHFLKKQTDWKLAVPTLPGHGDTLNLKGIQYNQWIKHAEQELEKLLHSCEKVYVVGFSMGGMIASYLAVHFPVEKLVLLSAAAYYVNPKQLTIDIAAMMKDLYQGKLNDNELFLRYKRKLKETPLAATLQFRKLVYSIRPLVPQISVPTFIAQGEVDGVVPPKAAQYLYSNIGSSSKKLFYLKNSKHLICHSDERDDLFENILHFLKAGVM
ncbi:alpha/beta fold hydrolase [Niallia oryzisoli]|uniref:Alpha/beta fold hydrolase n=1 Tax=Niallia oryzisoli TaxID=1737571 RepID=A0ABZ2CLA8_9BACI